MLKDIKHFVLNYSNVVFIGLLGFLIISLVILILSSQNLLTPKQNRRIAKLKVKSFEIQKKSKSNKYTPKILLRRLIEAAGFEGNVNQITDVFSIFALITFLFAGLLVYMLGFSFIGSILFAVISLIISPVVPVLVLMYLKAVRDSLITEEIFVVMTHTIDAVQSAGKTLQGGLEDALYAAPTLQPYLQQFLNTYLMIGLPRAVERLRDKIQLEEMGMFLDLISHGFEHTPQELLKYFESESDAYHELEITSKQRRMGRREMFFDVLIAFPYVEGFLLMIYPVFKQGMQAISHTF